MNEQRKLKNGLFILTLPLLALGGIIGVSVVPIKVKEARQLIQTGEYRQAYENLSVFLEEGSKVNHFAWAYRALAQAKMGMLDQALKDAERSISTKWKFGNGGWLDFSFIFRQDSSCESIIMNLDVSKNEREYLASTICQ